MTTPTLQHGAPAWREEISGLHTQSPLQAQAWREHGLDVVEITDPVEVDEALDREGIVWVTP